MSRELPANPSLEHLKNQAKALLKALRSNDPSALSRMDASHPHYANAAAIRQRSFVRRLSDALLVIAREYGFPSWQKLKTYVEALAGKPRSATGAELFGTVMTPDQRPAPNATVSWIERNPGRVRLRHTTTTDEQGRFHFPETLPEHGEAFGVTLMVQAEGCGLSFQTRYTASMDVVLRRPTTLCVRFTDSEGKPIPRLRTRVNRFYAESLGSLGIPDEMHGLWEQQSDANGECVFSGLPQGVRAWFAVEDEAFATPGYEEGVMLAESETQQPAAIRLLMGGVVQGRVTHAEEGGPMAGVHVAAQAVGLGSGGGNAFTDANGVYRIAQLRPGDYNIMVYLSDEWERKATARAGSSGGKAGRRPGSAGSYCDQRLTYHR